MTRNYSPSRGSAYGAYGGHGRRTPERRAPVDRRSWLTMLEFAALASQDPAAQPYDLAASLKGLTGDNFPVAVGDIRHRWAKTFVEQAHLWVGGGAGTRRSFAPLIADGAKALKDILVEAGASEAIEARQRMGFRED